MITNYIHTTNAERLDIEVNRQEGTKTDFIGMRIDNNDVTIFMSLEQMIELRDKLTKHIRKVVK